MSRKVIFISLAVLCLTAFQAAVLPFSVHAQKVSLSTNLVDWADLGTINGEVGVSVARHFTIHAGARYNNWTFRPGQPEDRFEDPYGDTERQFENRKQSYSLTIRYWPWYVYSGWWFYVKGQYMEYNRGGLINHTAEEGDAFGGGLGFGYTYMLSKNWNIDFGAGAWAGSTTYSKYRCTNCGSLMEEGRKFFILPDTVILSLSYIF